MLVSYNYYTKKYAVEFGIGYGIAFDGAGTWRFGNDYARNVTIFDVDNSSSSHSDNDIKIFFEF